MFDFFEAERVGYVVAMAGNAVFAQLAEPRMKRARRMSQKGDQTEHVYRECRYAARSWSRERRIILDPR